MTTRKRADLVAMLDDHVRGLSRAGEQFDQGRFAEVRTLAAHVRRLVHPVGPTRDLVCGLGLHDRLTWVDTAGVPNPKTASSAACLTLMKVRTGPKAGGEYVPKFNLYPPAPIRTRSGGHIDRGSRIPFDHWWTNPVIKDADATEYSRKTLVLAMSASDRDARADVEVAEARAALARSASLGWIVSELSGAAPLAAAGNPVTASIRQIGHEVIETIRQQRPVIDDARGGVADEPVMPRSA